MKLLLASLVLALGMITTVWALEIKLPENASVNAKLAATFLKDELPPAAKGEIKLINGKNMRLEQWKLTGDGKCVTITAGKRKKTITFCYEDNEDLDRFLRRLCGDAFMDAE